MTSTFIAQLSELVAETVDGSAITQTLKHIEELLLQTSLPEYIGGENSFGETGLELSSERAAACIGCDNRTPKYWRALINAVEQCQTEDKVRILYPGSGPFATLVLPIFLTNFAQQIELVLLDLNNDSISNARQLWQPLQSENLQISFQLTNALDFQSDEQFDIIIFECLLQALEQEAQVAITAHVTKMLKAEGVLIPQQIECFLVATSMAAEIETLAQVKDKTDANIESVVAPFRQKQQSLLRLNKTTHETVSLANSSFYCGEFNVSDMDIKQDWVITTVISLDQQNVLHEYQCGLTYPFRVNWNRDVEKPLKVFYRLRPMPGFFVEEVGQT